MAPIFFALTIRTLALADTPEPTPPNLSPLCYFHNFNPQNFPWELQDCLNFEEVFKNYQYDEVKYDRKAQQVSIRHVVQNQTQNEKLYKLKFASSTWRLVPVNLSVIQER